MYLRRLTGGPYYRDEGLRRDRNFQLFGPAPDGSELPHIAKLLIAGSNTRLAADDFQERRMCPSEFCISSGILRSPNPAQNAFSIDPADPTTPLPVLPVTHAKTGQLLPEAYYKTDFLALSVRIFPFSSDAISNLIRSSLMTRSKMPRRAFGSFISRAWPVIS